MVAGGDSVEEGGENWSIIVGMITVQSTVRCSVGLRVADLEGGVAIRGQETFHNNLTQRITNE